MKLLRPLIYIAYLSLAMIAFLCASVANAFSSDEALSSLLVTYWTKRDGMPHSQVRIMQQDSDGYLWIGTQSGLARFDGRKFVTFSPADNPGLLLGPVGSILEDKQKRLWIGGLDGLSVREKDSFRSIDSKDGLSAGAVTALALDEANNLWIAVYGAGVFTEVNGQFKLVVDGRQLGDGAIFAIQAHDGQLWLASTVEGLLHWDKVRLKKYGVNDGLPSTQVTGLAVDASARLLAATAKGVVFFDGAQFRKLLGLELLNGENIRAVRVDKDGAIWIGGSAGVIRIRGTRVERLGKAAGLSDDFVTSIHEDRQGDLWISTRNGLNRFTRPALTKIDITDPVSTDRPAICEDSTGSLWASMESRPLLVRNGDVFTQTKSPFSAGPIHCSQEGSIFFATGEYSIWQLPSNQLIVNLPRASKNRITAISSSSDGAIWIGTNGGGVYRYARGELKNYLANEAVSSNVVFSVLASGNDVWVGYEFGVGRVSGDTIVLLAGTSRTSATIVKGFAVGALGELWMATEKGLLASFEGSIKSLNIRNGLRINSTAFVAIDPSGALWAAGDEGLIYVSKRELERWKSDPGTRISASLFNEADGMQGSVLGTFQYRGWLGKSGRLWLAAPGGVRSIDIGQPGRKSSQPVPLVDGIRIEGTRQKITSEAVVMVQEGDERIEFLLSAPHLTEASRVNIRYRLSGQDYDWVQADPDNPVASYTNLPAGRYTFRVSSRIGDADWTEAKTAYKIRKLPKYYESWWFYCLIILAIVCVLSVAYQIQLRQFSAKQKAILDERIRMARELHDTLLQRFYGLAWRMDAATIQIDQEPSKAAKMLREAVADAKHALAAARASILDLRSPINLSVPFLEHLKGNISSLAKGRAVQIKFEFELQSDEIAVEVRQTVMRIAEEAVTNALKHADPSEINIKIMAERNNVVVEITDDGYGFEALSETAIPSGHWGLLGMQERAEQLGGQFRIHSEMNKGTTVRASLPNVNRK
jgi:signal transduction histidine kinase/ligand-binding sensor domain-containing protein